MFEKVDLVTYLNTCKSNDAQRQKESPTSEELLADYNPETYAAQLQSENAQSLAFMEMFNQNFQKVISSFKDDKPDAKDITGNVGSVSDLENLKQLKEVDLPNALQGYDSISSAESALATIQGELSTHQQEATDAEAEYNEAIQGKEEAAKEYDVVYKECNSLENEQEQCQQDKSKAEQDYQSASDTITNKSNENTILESEIATLEKSTDPDAKNQIKEKKDKIKANNQAIKDAKRKQEECKQIKEAKDKRINEIKTNLLPPKEKEKEELAKQIGDECVKLHETMVKAKEAVENDNKKIQDIQSIIANAKQVQAKIDKLEGNQPESDNKTESKQPLEIGHHIESETKDVQPGIKERTEKVVHEKPTLKTEPKNAPVDNEDYFPSNQQQSDSLAFKTNTPTNYNGIQGHETEVKVGDYSRGKKIIGVERTVENGENWLRLTYENGEKFGTTY